MSPSAIRIVRLTSIRDVASNVSNAQIAVIHRQLGEHDLLPTFKVTPANGAVSSRKSRRVAVHGSQSAVSECEDRRHVHSFADNLDIGAGFAFTGGFHRGIQFAERRDPR
jgi:hypothetical protein